MVSDWEPATVTERPLYAGELELLSRYSVGKWHGPSDMLFWYKGIIYIKREGEPGLLGGERVHLVLRVVLWGGYN